MARTRSRGTRPSSFGKCEGRLDVPVPSQVETDFRAVASLMRKPASVLAREIIETYLYGKVQAIRIAVNGEDGDGRNVG